MSKRIPGRCLRFLTLVTRQKVYWKKEGETCLRKQGVIYELTMNFKLFYTSSPVSTYFENFLNATSCIIKRAIFPKKGCSLNFRCLEFSCRLHYGEYLCSGKVYSAFNTYHHSAHLVPTSNAYTWLLSTCAICCFGVKDQLLSGW